MTLIRNVSVVLWGRISLKWSHERTARDQLEAAPTHITFKGFFCKRRETTEVVCRGEGEVESKGDFFKMKEITALYVDCRNTVKRNKFMTQEVGAGRIAGEMS